MDRGSKRVGEVPLIKGRNVYEAMGSDDGRERRKMTWYELEVGAPFDLGACL